MAEQAQAPAVQKRQGLVVIESRGEKIELTPAIVRNYLVTGRKELITDQEIFYFLGICKARHLNPFVKDCYLIKYTNEPAAIVVAIDFYRSRAKAMPDCTGWKKGVVCLKENGELRYSMGLVLPGETLVGGWFRATPKGWTQPLELEVNLSGYIKKKQDGSITRFWSAENQPSQIMKVAESQGLRTVWPDEFAGTVTGDEAGIDLSAKAIVLEPSNGDASPDLDEAAVEEFDRLVKNECKEYVAPVQTQDEVFNFLSQIAKVNKQTVEAVKAQAGTQENFPAFWKSFLAHQKKSAKGKAPKPTGETQEATPKQSPTPEPEATTGEASESQGPSLTSLVESLAGKGWPVAKLQVRFGKPMADWSEVELKVLADLDAE